MFIKAYHEKQKIYHGTRENFLRQNEHDEDLKLELDKLDYQGSITFNFYHSGEWMVSKTTDKL